MTTKVRNPKLAKLLEEAGSNPIKEAFSRSGFEGRYGIQPIEWVKEVLEKILTAENFSKPIRITMPVGSEEHQMLRNLLDDPKTARQLKKATGCQVAMKVDLRGIGYILHFC